MPRSKIRSAGQLTSFMDSLENGMLIEGREFEGLIVEVEGGGNGGRGDGSRM